MPRSNREVERILQSKFGFEEPVGRGTGHRWLALRVEGSPDVLTMFSHGTQEVGAKLLGKIARQLHVNSHYLEGMLSCSNGRDQYYARLRERDDDTR